MRIATIDMDPELVEIIRESTTHQQWRAFLDSLRESLLGRMISTPDSELPKLKHKLEYVEELKDIFEQIVPK